MSNRRCGHGVAAVCTTSPSRDSRQHRYEASLAVVCIGRSARRVLHSLRQPRSDEHVRLHAPNIHVSMPASHIAVAVAVKCRETRCGTSIMAPFLPSPSQHVHSRVWQLRCGPLVEADHCILSFVVSTSAVALTIRDVWVQYLQASPSAVPLTLISTSHDPQERPHCHRRPCPTCCPTSVPSLQCCSRR